MTKLVSILAFIATFQLLALHAIESPEVRTDQCPESICKDTKTVCPTGCTSCLNLQECLTCKYGYFLYHTLENDVVVCVKCPYYSDWTNPSAWSSSAIYQCTQCIQNSHSWEFTRTCQWQLDYTVTGNPVEFSVPRKDPDPVKYQIYRNPSTGHEVKEMIGCKTLQSNDFLNYQNQGLYFYSGQEIPTNRANNRRNLRNLQDEGEIDPGNEQAAPEEEPPAEEPINNDETGSEPTEQNTPENVDVPEVPLDITGDPTDDGTEKFEQIDQDIVEDNSNIEQLIQSTIVYTIDEFNECVEALPGYNLDQISGILKQCPDGCDNCYYHTDGTTLLCRECREGYTLDYKLTCVSCSTVSGCLRCTISSLWGWPLDLYAPYDWEYYYTEGYQVYATIQEYYLQSWGFDLSTRQTWCYQCLPEKMTSLDLRTCESCSVAHADCGKCDYSFSDGWMRWPDYPAWDPGSMLARCISCQGGQAIREDGKTCEACTISGCKKCYFGSDKTNLLTFPDVEPWYPNQMFTPLATLSNTQFCYSCDSSQDLAADSLSCTDFTVGADNCVIKSDNKCVECADGYILDLATNTCDNTLLTCDKAVNQACQRCYRHQVDFYYEYICTKCKSGFMPTLKGCVRCGSDLCIACSQVNEYGRNLTDFIVYKKPQIPSYYNEYYTSPDFGFKLLSQPYCGAYDTNKVDDINNNAILIDGSLKVCKYYGECNCVKNEENLDVECIGCGPLDGLSINDGKFSVSKNLKQCMECPRYCPSCTQREQESIQKLNPFFEVMGKYYIYSNVCNINENGYVWNSQFDRVMMCSDGALSCKKTKKETIVIDCNAESDGFIGDYQSRSLSNIVKKFNSILTTTTLETNDQLLEDNQEMYTDFEIQYLIYTEVTEQLEFPPTEIGAKFDVMFGMTACLFSDFTFTTSIPQNVFATKNMKIQFNTITYNQQGNLIQGINPAFFVFKGNITFQFFNVVEFNNIYFGVHEQFKRSDAYTIRIRQVMGGLDLVISDCIFGWRNNHTTKNNIRNTQKYITFQLTNAKSVTLVRSSFNQFTYPDSARPFSYVYDEFNSGYEFTLIANDLTLFKNELSHTVFFVSPLLYYTFEFSNIIIENNIFLSDSQFLSDEIIVYDPTKSETPTGTLRFSGMNLIQNQFINSNFILMNQLSVSEGNNLAITGDKYQGTTRIYSIINTNMMVMEEIYIAEGVVFQNSVLFSNPTATKLILESQNQVLVYKNMKVDNITCINTSPCLFNFITPTSDTTILQKIIVFLQNINISRINDLGDDQMNKTIVQDFRDKNVDNSLIKISDAEYSNLVNVNFIDNMEITMIYLENVKTFVWKDSECSFTVQNTNVTEFDTKQVNFSYVAGPQNKKEENNTDLNFNGFLFQRSRQCVKGLNVLQNFTMVNINMEWLFAPDNSLVFLENQNQPAKYPIDPQKPLVITIANVSLNNSLLAITEQYSNIAPIMLQNDQVSIINFRNVTFNNTILFTFDTVTTLYPSTSNIYINGLQCIVNIANSTFVNSSSYQNYNGLYIIADSINVQNSSFKKSNPSGIVNNFNYTTTLGGFGFLQYLSSLSITNNTLQDGFAINGAGFYILPVGRASGAIDNCSFINLHTSMNSSAYGLGGAIFFDMSLATKTFFNVSNSVFKNVSARTFGGSIYISGSTSLSKFVIDSIKVSNSFAIKGAVVYIDFANKQYVNLFMINSQITNSKNLTDNYFLSLQSGMVSPYAQDLDSAGFLADNSLFHIKGTVFRTINIQIDTVYYYRIINLALSNWTDYGSNFQNIIRYMNEIVKSDATSLLLNYTSFDNISSTRENGIPEDCELEKPQSPEYASRNQLCILWKNGQLAITLLGLSQSSEDISILNSNFSNSQCDECLLGLIYIYDTPSLLMSSNLFSNNTVESGTVSIFSEPQQIADSNNSTNETRRQRRVIQQAADQNYLQYQMEGNSFSGNVALKNAAGVTIKNQPMIITGNFFSGNTAGGIGSAIMAENAYFEITNCSLTNNNAFSGGSMRIIALKALNGTQLTPVETGELLSSNNQFANNTSFQGSGDIVTTCVLGEFSDNNVCIPCPVDTFNLIVSTKPICQACPSESASCPGGFYIEVRPGYWRPDILNPIIEKCQAKPSNCIGGLKTQHSTQMQVGNDLCSLGHIGALCQTCDLYNITGTGSFANTGTLECANCGDLTGPNATIIVFISLISLIFIAFSVRSTMLINKSVAAVQDVPVQISFFRLVLEKFVQTDEGALFIKIFINYTQIISTIFTFNISIPSEAGTAIETAGTPIQKALFSMDCFLLDLAKSGNVPIEYMRLIWTFVIPVMYILLQFSGYIIYKVILRQKFETEVFSTGLIFLYIFYQPSIILNFVSTISCRVLSGRSYIISQVNKQCYTDEHKFWSGLFVYPMLILFSLVVPGSLFLILKKRKNELRSGECRKILGILYNEAYFWEVIRIIQKTLIIIFVNFFNQDDTTQGCLIFFMIMMYSMLSLRYRPYIKTKLNELDQQSSIVMGISIVLAIMASANSAKPETLWLFVVTMVVLVCINAHLILAMIRDIILSNIQELGENGQPIKVQCHQYVPCMRPYILLRKTQPGQVKALWAMTANYFADFRRRRLLSNQANFYEHSQGQLDWQNFVVKQEELIEKQNSQKQNTESAKKSSKVSPISLEIKDLEKNELIQTITTPQYEKASSSVTSPQQADEQENLIINPNYEKPIDFVEETNQIY